MTLEMYTDLGQGITCIDAGYIRPGLACCYLMVQDGEAAIIETGTNHTVERICDLLARKGIETGQVRYVIPTHVHLDHAGGAGGLMSRFEQAELIIHPRGARHMENPERLVAGTVEVYGQQAFDELYGRIIPIPADRTVQAQDSMKLTLGSRELEIRHAPGHAEHHFCVWDERSRGWFTGDNFGISYPELGNNGNRYLFPTTTPVQFDPQKLLDTLEMLMSYQPEILYLTHFSGIKNPELLADQLRNAILKYVELALENAAADDPAAAIQEAITDYEVTRLMGVLDNFSEARARDLLAMDMRLNSQGLAVWLERRDS